MKPVPPKSDAASPRTEKRLENHGVSVDSAAEARRLLHELQVHQIELEMQNEALQAARNDIEAVQERYAELYDFAPVGYLSTDAQCVVLQCNLTAARLLGSEPSLLIGLRFDSFLAPDDRSRYLDFSREVAQTDAILKIEAALNSGLSVHMEAKASNDRHEIRVALLDVTESKRAEEQLKLAALVYEISDEGIMVTDPSGLIAAVNTAFTKVTGYDKSEALGKGAGMLRSGSHSKEFYQDMWRSLHECGHWQGEIINRRKNGELFDEWLVIDTVVDAAGGVLSRVGVFSDVTEKKKTAARDLDNSKKLSEQKENLERSNSDLERFAYVASHDLREPLRMISSFLSLLERRNPGLDEQSVEFLNYAREGAVRLDGLMLALLEYSRVGRIQTRPESVESRAIVAQAVENLAFKIAETNSKIVVDENLPAVIGHYDELVCVFQNLLTNSIKYRQVGRAAEIGISALKQNGKYLFSVTDKGIGIGSEYFEQIFVIFQRLHTRSQYEGVGIGLALCKKIIDHHGGKIWVESIPNQETTFFFTLPADQREIV